MPRGKEISRHQRSGDLSEARRILTRGIASTPQYDPVEAALLASLEFYRSSLGSEARITTEETPPAESVNPFLPSVEEVNRVLDWMADQIDPSIPPIPDESLLEARA